jgi:hypothetical protein
MKLVIEGNEYAIKPFTIGDYLELKDTDLEKMTDLMMLERFTTAPIEEIKKIPYQKVKFIGNIIRSSFGSDTDALPLALTIKIGDTYFGLIKPSEISYEEWINLEVFMTENPLDLLKLSTHLYKPLKNEKMGDDRELIGYSLDECNSRQELFRDMYIGNLMSALFFLISFAEKLTESLLGSMENKMKQNQQKNEQMNLKSTPHK